MRGVKREEGESEWLEGKMGGNMKGGKKGGGREGKGEGKEREGGEVRKKGKM